MPFFWRTLRLACPILALVPAIPLCLPFPLRAQSSNASLTGRITDPSKAVIPTAKIAVINTGTRIHYVTVTNGTGSYYVANLPPGTYRIEVEKLGFKTVIKSDLVLHVQDALEINFEMAFGSASESVTVQGGAPLLETESSTVGTVVEQRKANELPLNGRNVFNLIELAPSVVPQGSATGTPVGVNPFGWGNYQVNGSFANESAEYLDGQPLNIGYINLPILIPTQDSIEYEKALKLRPDLPELHLELGQVYANSGRWPEAEEQFRAETKLQPGNAEAAYRLGQALLQQGKASAALPESARLRT